MRGGYSKQRFEFCYLSSLRFKCVFIFSMLPPLVVFLFIWKKPSEVFRGDVGAARDARDVLLVVVGDGFAWQEKGKEIDLDDIGLTEKFKQDFDTFDGWEDFDDRALHSA